MRTCSLLAPLPFDYWLLLVILSIYWVHFLFHFSLKPFLNPFTLFQIRYIFWGSVCHVTVTIILFWMWNIQENTYSGQACEMFDWHTDRQTDKEGADVWFRDAPMLAECQDIRRKALPSYQNNNAAGNKALGGNILTPHPFLSHLHVLRVLKRVKQPSLFFKCSYAGKKGFYFENYNYDLCVNLKTSVFDLRIRLQLVWKMLFLVSK